MFDPFLRESDCDFLASESSKNKPVGVWGVPSRPGEGLRSHPDAQVNSLTLQILTWAPSLPTLAWGTSCASALGNVLLVTSNTNPCILAEPKKTGEGIIRRIGGESNPWWIQGCDLAWTKMPSGAKLRVFQGFSLSFCSPGQLIWSAHPPPSLFRLFHLQDKRWLSHCYQIISLQFKWWTATSSISGPQI